MDPSKYELRANEINDKLMKLMATSSVVSHRRLPGHIMEQLRELNKLPMTLHILMNTSVGLTVNRVYNLNLTDSLSQFALELVIGWSQLIPLRETHLLNEFCDQEITNDTKNDENRKPRRRKQRSPKKLVVNNMPNTRSDLNESEKSDTSLKAADINLNSNETIAERNNFRLVNYHVSNDSNRVINSNLSSASVANEIISMNASNVFIDRINTETRAKQSVNDLPLKQIENNNLSNGTEKSQFSADEQNKENQDTNCDALSAICETKTDFLTTFKIPRKLKAFEETDESSTNQLCKVMTRDESSLYEQIIKTNKRKRDSTQSTYFTPPTKLPKYAPITLKSGKIGYFERTEHYVQNCPVPRTQPLLTPEDRIRIVKARHPRPAQDSDDPESQMCRASSKKDFKLVARKEHVPKW